VIVAGAKSKNTLKLLGYDYAKNLNDVIEKSRKKLGEICSIAYICIRPIFLAGVKK